MRLKIKFKRCLYPLSRKVIVALELQLPHLVRLMLHEKFLQASRTNRIPCLVEF